MHALEDGTSFDKETPDWTIVLLEEPDPSGALLPSISRSKPDGLVLSG
jgi:hypothetical protein